VRVDCQCHQPFLVGDPAVFDIVPGSVWEVSGDALPLGAEFRKFGVEKGIFLGRPWNVGEVRVDVVVPAFATLTGISRANLNRHKIPISRPISLNSFAQPLIFPGSKFGLELAWTWV
jgi:hypothetical protein